MCPDTPPVRYQAVQLSAPRCTLPCDVKPSVVYWCPGGEPPAPFNTALYVVVLAKPGDTIPLGQRYLIRPFPTDHVIPSLGYTLFSVRKKLKPKLQGMRGEGIRRLREKGVEVSDILETPEVAFTGDTRAEALDLDVVRKARLLIAECTFVDEKIPVEKARRTYHTHLDEIIARADNFENEQIILTHFSARYRKVEIDLALASLPPALRYRVRTLM